MGNLRISSKFDPSADVILYQGDVKDYLDEIPDNFIDLVITSPPYNIGKSYEQKIELDEYIKQQEEIIQECVRVLKETGSICWQLGNYIKNSEIIPLDIILFPIFNRLKLKLRNRIVWHFGHGLHASKRFSGRYEVLLWFTKSDNYIFNLDKVRIPQKYPNKKYFKGPKKGLLSGNPLGKNPSDIWNIPNVKANHIEKTIHPCQFPVELIERMVLSLTNEDNWVFDPFIGVGTTAIASLIHKRKVMGAEIQKEYVEIAKQRIRLAEEGELQIRPMDRQVFDPNDTSSYIPPKKINLDEAIQPAIFDKKTKYQENKK